jgi:hypothetical protein
MDSNIHFQDSKPQVTVHNACVPSSFDRNVIALDEATSAFGIHPRNRRFIVVIALN